MAAQQGSSQAAAFLGAVYLHGNAGVIQDVKKGVKFLEQGIACNERATWAKGIAEGILGQALVEGLIVPKKVNRGVKLLKEACFADDTYAKTVLGQMYVNGDCTNQKHVSVNMLQQSSVSSSSAKSPYLDLQNG